MKFIQQLLFATLIVAISLLVTAQAAPDGYLVRNGQKIFLNGANIAWHQFARDFSDRYHAGSLTAITTAFKNIKSAGGNFARLWLHTNGVDTPAFSNGKVTGMGANKIERVIKILDAAADNGIIVELALWSFDMVDPAQWEMTQQNINQNNAILRDSSSRKAYIDNALIPLVKALKGHPGLFGYDIFNEPEGIVSGWSLGNCGTIKCPPKFTLKEIQLFINQFAGAVRSVDKDTFITVGSGPGKHTNLEWYTDEALIAAGGDKNGVLTHASAHYYPYGSTVSPFLNPFKYWNSKKPMIIGEFPGIGMNQNLATQKECGNIYKLTTSQYMSSAQCYQAAYNGGYAGLAGWQYKSTSGCNKKFLGDWADMKLGVQALKGKACISLTDSSCRVSSGGASASASKAPAASGSAKPSRDSDSSDSCSLSSKTLSGSASDWVVRNGWGMGDGSTLTASNSMVTFQPRQWGRSFYWLVSTDKFCVEKGKSYTFKFGLSEESSNKVLGSGGCSSNGCLGMTVQSASVSLVKGFSTTLFNAEGVDASQLVALQSSSSSVFANDAASPSAVPSSFSRTITFSESANDVVFAVKVTLFGKPSAASNKYTMAPVTITKN